MGETKRTPNITEQQKTVVLEQLWLSYYNDTLFKHGIITETERNKMRILIKNRMPSCVQ